MSANDDNQHHHEQHEHVQVEDEEQNQHEEQQVEGEVTFRQLEEAARQGNVELLERVPLHHLLDYKHSYGLRGGDWLFWEAVEHKQGGVVQCLVRRSVESGEDFVLGWTLGHAAAYVGDLAALGALSEEQVRAANYDGESLLYIAAWGGHVAAIERLVELGADLNATNLNGWTCLHVAAEGGHVTAIERLVELGADSVLTQHEFGQLLVKKAKERDVAAVEQLLRLGTDPNVADDNGETCLAVATRTGPAEATAQLLLMGADPTNDARTILDADSAFSDSRSDSEAATLLLADSGWLARRSGDGAPLLEKVERLSHELGPVAALAALGCVSSPRVNEVLAVWPQLQSLEVLCLRGIAAADFARLVAKLDELFALRRLFLGGVEAETLRVSASQLATIADLPLTTLELSHMTFEDATALRGCTSLASRKLSSCTLSTADINVVASLPQLERLDLRGARFPNLDPLSGGCTALQSLDVRDCGLTSAPAFLASLPRLEQLFVLGNPFVDELQEYHWVLAHAIRTVELFFAQSLSSESKVRDVPVVMVGHGRAGKSQVIRALLHEPTAEPGIVEHVELMTERTSMIESGIHALQLQAERQGRTRWQARVDEFETRFFDTPGQMEFFASNMAVISPMFSNGVVLVVVRCVPHGVDGADVSLVAEKKRIVSEFRLWLAEVSRAVLSAPLRNSGAAVKLTKVLLVLTHRDVLEEAQGEAAVDDMLLWLDWLCSELHYEFSETLEVQYGIDFVNSTVASESGHGVTPLRQRLADVAHGVFESGPLLPDVLVDARALVVSEEVRRLRVCERKTLEELLTSRLGDRGLTPRLSQSLLDVLESNGSVLRTPGRQLVVVDPGWISRVMSSLYVDPKAHDVVDFRGDPSEFDALAAFDEDGEVQESDLLAHLQRFVDGDDALLERLVLVLVSNGIVIPLRVRSDIKRVPVMESYLIVGRWMDAQDGDGCVQWNSSRQDEAAWFELVTGKPYSLQNVASAFALARSLRQQRPSFYLTPLRCETGVPLGPSFLTRMVHRLAQLFHSSRHSFLVRRTDFVCVLPFTRFHAAVHVRLPPGANTFELTLVAARDDAEAALEFALLECVFPVLKMMTLDDEDHWLHVKQRCSACVATREDLTSRIRHDRELASGESVCRDVEAVRALCGEVVGDGRNWQYDECRGCGGALSTVEVAQVDHNQQSSSFGDSVVPGIPPASINLDDASVLGSGQFGSVLTGEFNGTEVVLKDLKVSSPEALAAFEREAQLLGRACKHPCFSQLLGVCRMSESQVYVVMERAGVCDLEQALCEPVEKPLLGATWDEFGVLLGLLADVASALRHMHSQDPPIVHNDVALRNVLVRHENGRNRAKLTDMGLACVVPRGRVHKLAPGTPAPMWQMAPETLESRVVSPASDVFQFGMLVYEMLARQRPFWREWKTPGSKEECSAARAAVVECIKNGKRPALEDVEAAGAHCNDALWQLAEECWLDDPLLRPTMVQVSTRLAKFARERSGVPDSQAPLGQRSAATQGPRYPKLAPEPVDDDDDDSGDDDEEAKAEDSEDPSTVPVASLGLLSAFYVSHPPVRRPGAFMTASPALSATLAAVYAAVNPTSPEGSSSPAHVCEWSVDDVCAWLLQLGVPACVELIPHFRHHGVDGELLLELDYAMLSELDVKRLTARALFKARDKLTSPDM